MWIGFEKVKKYNQTHCFNKHKNSQLKQTNNVGSKHARYNRVWLF